MKIPPLRIGLLGAARIAPPALVQPARRCLDAVAQAIAARDEDRARAFASEHGVPTVLPDYAALVESDEIDAVYVGLPISAHKEWTIRALRAGKHVLCEKAIANNADEAAEMAAVADETGKVLVEAFHWRYHPLAERLIEIARHDLGKLEQASCSFCVPHIPEGDIRYQYELGGGALMDLGCYPVSMLRHVIGAEPEVVSAEARSVPRDVDVEIRAQLRFPGDIRAEAHCCMDDQQPLGCTLSLRGDAGEMQVTNPIAPHIGHQITLRGADGEHTESVAGDTTYDHQLRAFVSRVQGGDPLPTEGADATANMRVIDAIYRAAGLPPRGT